MKLFLITLLVLIMMLHQSQASITRKDGSNGTVHPVETYDEDYEETANGEPPPSRSYGGEQQQGPSDMDPAISRALCRSANCDYDTYGRTQSRRITWRIWQYHPQNGLSLSELTNALRRSMQMWSNVAAIDFVQTFDDERSVDIDFVFERSNYDYSCRKYFDQGQSIHSTNWGLPSQIHYNGNTVWRVNENYAGNNLVADTAHQIGHALGLSHSYDQNALMHSRVHNSVLGQDDVRAIQRLYGSRPNPGPGNGDPISKKRPSCPLQVTFYMPNAPRRMCAAVYVENYCQGSRLPLADGAQLQQLDQNWFHEISSAEINPGCRLTVCRRRGYNGGCTYLVGEDSGQNYNLMPNDYNDFTASLYCQCR